MADVLDQSFSTFSVPCPIIAMVLKLWYASAFQVAREQLSCHIRKALLIRFCVIIRLCVMLMLLIHLCAILILSTFEQITFF